MDLALYDPELGYYARAAQRSGARAIFLPASTSARCSASCSRCQLAEMARHARIPSSGPNPRSTSSKPAPATAGSPPTSCAPRSSAIPTLYDRPPPASRRSERRGPRGAARRRSATSPIGSVVVCRRCPTSFEGVLIANELLDAHAGASGRDARRRLARSLRRLPTPPGSRLSTRRRSRRRRRRWRVSGARSESRSSRAGAPRSTCARSTGFATPRAGCAAGSSSSSTTATKRASSTRRRTPAGR